MDKDKRKAALYIILICALIIGVYFILNYNPEFKGIRHIGKKFKYTNIKFLREYILSYGKFSALAFIIIYSLKPIVLIIPTSLLSILAGSIFGPWQAFGLSMIGCFTSSSLAFFIARKFGSKFVNKLLKGKTLKLDESINNHGFLIMFLMRLSCVFAYDPLSYAAGFTKMKYRDFILGTLFGIVPEMLAYAFIGKNLRRPFSVRFFLPILGVIVVAAISYYFYKKLNNKNKV